MQLIIAVRLWLNTSNDIVLFIDRSYSCVKHTKLSTFSILGMIEMLFSNLLTNTVKPVNKGHSWEQYTLAFVGTM